MPIPILVWAALAGGAAHLAWTNRKKIIEYFESEEGKALLKKVGDGIDGATAPYQDIIEKSILMDSDLGKEYFRETRRRVSPTSWSFLMGHSRNLIRKDSKYFAAITDLNIVDSEPQ